MKSLGYEAVAELLGALAAFEDDHLRALESQSAGLDLPAVAPPAWPAQEAADLFMPRQVLAAALEAEQRSYAFYENVVMTAVDAAVREMAREMALEEAEHIALIERLLEGPPSSFGSIRGQGRN